MKVFKSTSLSFLVVLVACSDSGNIEARATAAINLPYINSCQETVDIAQRYYDGVNPKDATIEFKIIRFNQTALANFGLDGLLSIKSYGDLGLQSQVSDEYYLRGIADSIAIECLPIDAISFNDPIIKSQVKNLKNKSYSQIIPVYENGLLFLYHNKNKDKIDHWRN